MAEGKIMCENKVISNSFTENNYTVNYKQVGSVATVDVYRNSSTSTNVDFTTTGTVPKPFALISNGNYSNTPGDFIEISTSGTVRIKHNQNSGWFRSVITYVV